MPTRLDLIMLVVRDMETSLRFYRDILRLPVAFQSPSWTELGPPEGTHLALYPENPAAGILVRPGSSSLGFYIYDVDGFVYTARSRGARVEREPANEEFGRYAELRDPDGYLIGLCRPKGMPLTEEITVPATPPAARPATAQGALGDMVIPPEMSTPKVPASAESRRSPVSKAASGKSKPKKKAAAPAKKGAAKSKKAKPSRAKPKGKAKAKARPSRAMSAKKGKKAVKKAAKKKAVKKKPTRKKAAKKKAPARRKPAARKPARKTVKKKTARKKPAKKKTARKKTLAKRRTTARKKTTRKRRR